MSTPTPTHPVVSLLPCPFCGDDLSNGEHDDECYFTVVNRFREAPPADVSESVNLLAAWNRRATPEPPGSTLSPGASSGGDLDPVACALEYYRAYRETRAPKWVPSRIYLHEPVRGDPPLGHMTVASAGPHDCESNKWGALSVLASNGHRLAIRPEEFQPLAWRRNEQLERRASESHGHEMRE